MATYFQVPDDRVLQSPAATKLPAAWPANKDGYRLFVSGAAGAERIGIEVGQKIELEAVGAKDLYLVTKEFLRLRHLPNSWTADEVMAQANATPAPIVLPEPVPKADKQKFTVHAKTAGATSLYVFDPIANATKAELEVVVGKFANHPGMTVDLIADVCRGADSLRIHALQRMLNNNKFLGIDPNTNFNRFNNDDNVFEQHADPNISPDSNIGPMSCGLVARWRTEQVFPKSVAPSFNWYTVGAIHEPLWSKPTDRTQVKYRSSRVETLRSQIIKALNDGSAVRAAVVDAPTVITPVNGALVAYTAGGHTIVVVGCNANGDEFLYIDPWGGGSQMEYKGGIPGAGFPGDCYQIGKLVVASDPARRAKAGDVGNNIIREHQDTQGTFTYAKGNYLEVVAAPFAVPGRGG